MNASTTKITYLFDPLCGWCYGAAPVLEQLAKLENITLQLAPTGLFAGENARPLDHSFAAFAWQNDQRIARLTGQIFSETYRTQILGNTSFLFDSAPATLAIVAVGMTEADRELEALKALQRARYVDGRDNANLAVVSQILAESGFAEAARSVASANAVLLEAYRYRIGVARRDMASFNAAQGVPILIIDSSNGRRILPSSTLFASFDTIESQIKAA